MADKSSFLKELNEFLHFPPQNMSMELVTNPTKKKIIEHLSKIYNQIPHEKKIPISSQQSSVKMDPKLLELCAEESLLESMIPLPYDLTDGHVYANHAHIRSGGGALTFGFVQEEQLMLISTYLNVLYQNMFQKQQDVVKANLERDCLLTACNVYAKQNYDMGLYGGDGMKKIEENPSILNDFYEPYPNNDIPMIYILSKAIPKKVDIEYKNFQYDGSNIIYWIFYEAYNAYLLAMYQCALYMDEINIHDGNWGCGVYGHNLNTICTILHLSFRAARQIFLCDPISKGKSLFFYYHTCHLDSLQILRTAMDFLAGIDNSATIGMILEQISSFHQLGETEWTIHF